jgi:hypothetical protein
MYRGNDGGTAEDLYASTDGVTPYTLDTANILVNSGDELSIKCVSILKDGANYYAIYDYSVTDALMPGLRFAGPSSDGKTGFTKHGTVIYKQPNTPWSGTFEAQHYLKIGNVYLIIVSTSVWNFGAPSGTANPHFTLNAFGSYTPNFQSWFHIPALSLDLGAQGKQLSTPHLKKLGSQWYLFFSQCSIVGAYSDFYHPWSIDMRVVDGNAVDAISQTVPATPADCGGTLIAWFRPDLGGYFEKGNTSSLADQSGKFNNLAVVSPLYPFAYIANDPIVNNQPSIFGTQATNQLFEKGAAITGFDGTSLTLVFVGYYSNSQGGSLLWLGDPSGGHEVVLRYQSDGAGNVYVAWDGAATVLQFAGALVGPNTKFQLVVSLDFSAHTCTCAINGVSKTITSGTIVAPSGAIMSVLKWWTGGTGDLHVFSPALTSLQSDANNVGYLHPRYSIADTFDPRSLERTGLTLAAAWEPGRSAATITSGRVVALGGVWGTTYNLIEEASHGPAYNATGWNGTTPALVLTAGQFLACPELGAHFAGTAPNTVLIALQCTGTPGSWVIYAFGSSASGIKESQKLIYNSAGAGLSYSMRYKTSPYNDLDRYVTESITPNSRHIYATQYGADAATCYAFQDTRIDGIFNEAGTNASYDFTTFTVGTEFGNEIYQPALLVGNVGGIWVFDGQATDAEVTAMIAKMKLTWPTT